MVPSHDAHVALLNLLANLKLGSRVHFHVDVVLTGGQGSAREDSLDVYGPGRRSPVAGKESNNLGRHKMSVKIHAEENV